MNGPPLRMLIKDHPNNERIRRAIINDLQSLDASASWEVTIKPWKMMHKATQRGYLWGVVYPTICDQHNQWTVDELHELCKKKFAPKEEVVLEDGKSGDLAEATVIQCVRRASKLLQLGPDVSRLLWDECKELTGKMIVAKSTGSMSAEEYWNFTDQVRRWADTTLDCPTPDPDPHYAEARRKALGLAA